MKLRFLNLFLVALITLAACNKEKDDVPVNQGPTPLLEYKSGEDYIKFQYNANGQVSNAIVKTDLNTGGQEQTYQVAYNAQGKIQSLTSGDEKLDAVYENGQLKRVDMLISNQRIGYTNYQFQNNTLKRATIYQGQGVDYEPVLDFDFTLDAQGNIAETLIMMANGVPGMMVRAGHVEFAYDQKNNPLAAHKDLLAFFWQGATKNNIILEEHYDAQQVLEDKYVYTYTYKANGLPASAVVKIGLPGQTLQEELLEFIYK